MFSIESKGDFKNIKKFAKKMLEGDIFSRLDSYGRAGVQALASATPVDSGISADSWDYEVVHKQGRWSLYWTNSNVTPSGVPIVILLQYGHGTGSGGYVQGQDFINPAIKDTFDKIAEQVWKEVTSA